MTLDAIKDWLNSAASNTDVAGTSIAEGCDPGNINNAIRGVMKQVADYDDDRSGITSSGGSSNAYTFAAASPTAAAFTGENFTFTANHTNTGASTINITPSGGSARGAVAIQLNGSALVGGEIVSGGVYRVVYTGSAYQLFNASFDKASPGAIGGTTPAAGSFTTLTKTSAAQAGFGLSFVVAYRSAGTENVTGNGTAYTITWNTELVDRAGDFASNTFTARYTGWHRVNIHLQAYNMTTSCTGYTVTAIATGQQYDLAGVTPSAGNAANQARIACSKVLYMTAADTLYFTFTATGEGSDVVDLDGGKKWSGLEIEYLGA